jgi:hypothetical protein
LKKVKGISRIDDPGRHGVGWYARVKFRGKTHSKYFSDGAHKGTRAAFAKALAWRDKKERELGKPRTDRIVPAGQRGPTRFRGVYRSKSSYVVAWSPSPGEFRREFISIARYGAREALRRAVELRRRRERAVYGKAISPESHGRRPRRNSKARASSPRARS